jgi:hypothetical protein
MRQAVETALPAVDQILSQHEGRRLPGAMEVLGSIPVETTVAGIRALADSDQIRAIMEDQSVSPILCFPPRPTGRASAHRGSFICRRPCRRS